MWGRQAGCRYRGASTENRGGYGSVIEVVARPEVESCGCGLGAAFLRRSTAMPAVRREHGTDCAL